jgi:hypothetical protein
VDEVLHEVKIQIVLVLIDGIYQLIMSLEYLKTIYIIEIVVYQLDGYVIDCDGKIILQNNKAIILLKH